MQGLSLGATPLQVCPLCIGTWAWGDQWFWGYGQDYGEPQVEAAFRAAVEAGITFFDTAEVYGFGLSEELLGRFLTNLAQPVQIATKYGPMPWRWHQQSVADALTASLKRLRRDRVELYQVHWPFTFLMSQTTLMDALAVEVKQGRIGAIGVSNYSAEQMRQAHDRLQSQGIPLAVNQVRYSLLDRGIEGNGILSTARELGVTILAYSPLAQGLLTGKYSPDDDHQPVGPRRFDPRFQPEGLRKLAPLLTLLQHLGDTHNRTPAQVALNWLMAQGNVIPIVGVKTADHVQQNAGAIGWSLTQDEVQQLASTSQSVT